MRQPATASRNNKNKPSSNLKMVGSVRVRVIRTLLAIQNGQSLSSVLDPLLNSLHEGDKGFAHALLLTTLRQWYALERLLDTLADNNIDEIEVRTTIQVGLTQLLYLEVADHAAIHETVEAVKEIDFAHASGLVNAILRKVVKNTNKFRKKCDKNHSLPNWLAYQLKQDWSEEYSALTQGLRQPAPMFLRVNTTINTVDAYQQALEQADVEAELVEVVSGLQLSNLTDKTDTTITTQALRLEQTTAVSGLPSFAEGAASVQDMHAQLAAPLIHQALINKVNADAINDNNGDANQTSNTELHILDACAAPGGKLAHWLELLNADKQSSLFHVKPSENESGDKTDSSGSRAIKLTAIDNEAPRIGRIHENLERLHLEHSEQIKLNVVCADATRWQGIQESKKQKVDKNEPVFDAILLDSPCTATGVIRRHPDISLLRTEEDVDQTASLQEEILDNLWPQLKVGGYLLYVTCSILKQENVEQMQAFLNHHTDATAIEFTEECSWGIAQEIGRQCLPIDSESGDGFYYALLHKIA
ncbi:transcription antitermination factor NusB [Psychrobacter sp. LV10R520-6]|uniref:transcription antitermination factor NusB n=1 Tax=Psychrobacter sp. LV10R520-6 TaxID=1415574 RepID=UPI0024C8728C|nr:transcription antitermination factor NusB [Psychrobacter sp. LV10R520-6]SNT71096.1 16S rRNA (cytosine967-C5)-methyltransferase [Psychrobacter sp. LV10R520-6]